MYAGSQTSHASPSSSKPRGFRAIDAQRGHHAAAGTPSTIRLEGEGRRAGKVYLVGAGPGPALCRRNGRSTAANPQILADNSHVVRDSLRTASITRVHQ